MFIKKLNNFFCDQASIGGERIISSLFELFIFMVEEGKDFFNQGKGEKRFASVEIEVIIFS